MDNKTPYEYGFEIGFRDGSSGIKENRQAPYNNAKHANLARYWHQGYKDGFDEGYKRHDAKTPPR